MADLVKVMEVSHITLTEEQEREGYGVENCEDRALVWHKENQITLLHWSPDNRPKG